MIEIKSKRESRTDAGSGQGSCRIHEKVGEAVAPGKSTYELDKYAEELIRKAKCTPSFLHLYDFPAACCVIRDEELIHGIPEKTRILKEGDIVSFDIGVNYKAITAMPQELGRWEKSLPMQKDWWKLVKNPFSGESKMRFPEII